jgi:hypothetical protein
MSICVDSRDAATGTFFRLPEREPHGPEPPRALSCHRRVWDWEPPCDEVLGLGGLGSAETRRCCPAANYSVGTPVSFLLFFLVPSLLFFYLRWWHRLSCFRTEVARAETSPLAV